MTIVTWQCISTKVKMCIPFEPATPQLEMDLTDMLVNVFEMMYVLPSLFPTVLLMTIKLKLIYMALNIVPVK